MLDTDQLRSFLAIVDSGSFTRASGRVNRTQSAVSMQIKRLEETLGRPLFVKQGRGVRLSQDGETLVDYAREILRLEAGAFSAISNKALAGRVTLGMPDDYADWLVADVVKQFARHHPLVELSIVCDNSLSLYERAASRELELAVVTACREETSHAATEVLARQTLRWIVGRRCAPLDRKPLPLALGAPSCSWRRTATEALDRAGVAWRLAMASQSHAAIMPLVEAGLALTVLPAAATCGDVRVVGDDEGMPTLPPATIGLIFSPAKPTREAQALADVLRAVVGESDDETIGLARRVA